MCAGLNSAPQHLYYSVSQALWQHVLSGAVAAMLVLPAVFGQGGWPRRALSWRWLAWLGMISYGIYLWHATIAYTLIRHDIQHWVPVLVIDLVLTIALAGTSYYLVERPLLRFKNRRSRRSSARVSEAGLASPPG